MDEIAPAPEAILDAITVLHGRKSAAYGTAWKRRGEVISVIANIARKVDRIENVARDATVLDGETSLDTAVDLLVYAAKYETYLADQSPEVDQALFNGEPGVGCRSEESRFADLLLRRLGEIVPTPATMSAAAASVVEAFNALERCFADDGWADAVQRVARADLLLRAAWSLVLATCQASPSDAQQLVHANRN